MNESRGRPKSQKNVDVVRISLTLQKGEDDDLRNFFSQIKPRKRAISIKMALRSGMRSFSTEVISSTNELNDTIENLVFD